MRDLLNKLTLFESTNEGSDAIIFKGKEIDTDTIEYDMQDFSDMIAPIESAKYTDGTEVDEEDFEELDQLPAMIDWISTDYMDRQADQADSYRDAQAHGDFESMSEDELPKITDEMNGMISDWIEKFSKFIGGNGDTLPDGYIQWALNSGITTDFVEQNEAEAMREKYGEDEFENDPLGHVDEMPITKAALEMIEKITGDDDIDTNARMIDKVQSGDADESTELNDIKQLSGLDTNEEDEQTFEGEEFYEYYGYLPWHEDIVDEAEYQGRKVKLGKPMQGDVKKFKVYVRDPKTKNIKKVNFGDPNMRIKKSNPKRRKSFRARHNCDNPGPRTKARYWSCRKW